MVFLPICIPFQNVHILRKRFIFIMKYFFYQTFTLKPNYFTEYSITCLTGIINLVSNISGYYLFICEYTNPQSNKFSFINNELRQNMDWVVLHQLFFL